MEGRGEPGPGTTCAPREMMPELSLEDFGGTARADAWRSTWERGAFLRRGLELLCVCKFLLVVINWFIHEVYLVSCAGGVTRVLGAPGVCWQL